MASSAAGTLRSAPCRKHLWGLVMTVGWSGKKYLRQLDVLECTYSHVSWSFCLSVFARQLAAPTALKAALNEKFSKTPFWHRWPAQAFTVSSTSAILTGLSSLGFAMAQKDFLFLMFAFRLASVYWASSAPQLAKRDFPPVLLRGAHDQNLWKNIDLILF